jgi:hypothetical protein
VENKNQDVCFFNVKIGVDWDWNRQVWPTDEKIFLCYIQAKMKAEPYN